MGRQCLTIFFLLIVSVANLALWSCSSNNGANNTTSSSSPSSDITTDVPTTASATPATTASATPATTAPATPATTETTLPGLQAITRDKNTWVGTVTVVSDGSSFLTTCRDKTTVIPLQPSDTPSPYGDVCPGGIVAMYLVKVGAPRKPLIPGHLPLENFVKQPIESPPPGFEYRARVLPLGATPVP